jgi:thiosulfate/3-mercaptopyruvate sulfurtransferase
VSGEWLAAQPDDGSVVTLHAAMRRTGYEEGHLPGARFLDLARLVWDGEPAWGTEMRAHEDVVDVLEGVGIDDGTRHIVVYGPNPLFASRTFLTLEVAGLRGRVHVLDGGYEGWVASGRAVTTEEPHWERGALTTSGPGDILVDADWIHERLDDREVALIDARPDDEYTGEDGGMGGMANPGHIPGAVQMYWEDLTESTGNPFLHGEEELASMFAAAGAEHGDVVVTYCMVGWRASYNYLVARMLGYETKFYDGSWHDWGTSAVVAELRWMWSPRLGDVAAPGEQIHGEPHGDEHGGERRLRGAIEREVRQRPQGEPEVDGRRERVAPHTIGTG